MSPAEPAVDPRRASRWAWLGAALRSRWLHPAAVAVVALALTTLTISPGWLFWDSSTQWSNAAALAGGGDPAITTQWPIVNTLLKVQFAWTPWGLHLYGFVQAAAVLGSLAYLLCSLPVSRLARNVTGVLTFLSPVVLAYAWFHSSDSLVIAGLALGLGALAREQSGAAMGWPDYVAGVVGLALLANVRREGPLLAVAIAVTWLWAGARRRDAGRRWMLLAPLVVVAVVVLPVAGDRLLADRTNATPIATDAPAWALLTWQSGAIDRLGPTASGTLTPMSELAETPVDDVCRDIRMWCPASVERILPYAAEYGRGDYLTALAQQARDHPGQVIGAVLDAYARQAGLTFPLADPELGRTDVPAYAGYGNDPSAARDLLVKAKIGQQRWAWSVGLRPWVWILLLVGCALTPARTAWLAGFVAALWATLLGLMAVVAPVADFRYEAGLIIIAAAITIATAITLVEGRAARRSA